MTTPRTPRPHHCPSPVPPYGPGPGSPTSRSASRAPRGAGLAAGRLGAPGPGPLRRLRRRPPRRRTTGSRAPARSTSTGSCPTTPRPPRTPCPGAPEFTEEDAGPRPARRLTPSLPHHGAGLHSSARALVDAARHGLRPGRRPRRGDCPPGRPPACPSRPPARRTRGRAAPSPPGPGWAAGRQCHRRAGPGRPGRGRPRCPHPERFAVHRPGTRPGPRGGDMPGAVNLPFAELRDGAG